MTRLNQTNDLAADSTAGPEVPTVIATMTAQRVGMIYAVGGPEPL